MKVLLDTNVILDFLLEREPFVQEASQIFAMVEEGLLDGLMCASTVTTIFYLANKILDRDSAMNALKKLLQLFEVTVVNRVVLEDALTINFTDFEDAVLYQSAYHAGANAIITRDLQGFKKAKLPVYRPGDFLKIRL